jgi:hypothetical protein
MTKKELTVLDPTGNPIFPAPQVSDAAAPARKKPEREPIPTDPAEFEIRHVARLVGHVERAWAQVPKELQDLYRPLFLKPFNAKPRTDLVEVKS